MNGKPSFSEMHFKFMFYVYSIRSESFSEKTYLGFTSNIEQRLAEHNSGKSIYTRTYKPWKLIGFLAFDQKIKALKFEKYLKTNAGKIFLRRYFNHLSSNP
jgi:putative endonuclease